jgi:hypothetical protein
VASTGVGSSHYDMTRRLITYQLELHCFIWFDIAITLIHTPTET